MTHAEIAARLRLPPGTVKGRMRLGLQKLRTSVDEAAASDRIRAGLVRAFLAGELDDARRMIERRSRRCPPIARRRFDGLIDARVPAGNGDRFASCYYKRNGIVSVEEGVLMSASQTIPATQLDLDNGQSAPVVNYDSHGLDEYVAKWDQPMGPGEMAVNDTRKVAEDGVFSISAVPFTTGADAIYDHAKYFAVSHDVFPMPQRGSLQFSVDIKASTPGAEPERVIHGSYNESLRPYAQSTIEGQQAALMFNMTNIETGQVFDWFVSGSSVFALIERLPSIITNPKLPTSDPDYVGLDRSYTQIIKSAPLKPGETHNFAIRYTRSETRSSVEYFLDGNLFATVDHVGIPLDTQGAPYTGVYPSLARETEGLLGYSGAPGEELALRMNTFAIGHGLYNVLDAFPFGHPDAPELAVSIPVAERLFGQGAQGEFSRFEIRTVNN